tara:strand:+ start:245 stop:724 length:480 start_codon:yes stop_codon:yes gene_type:complete
MTDEYGDIDLQELGEIARNWRDWRQALEESALDVNTPELTTLTELSRTEPLWQLAIASLAYVGARSPISEEGAQQGLALEDLSLALTSLRGRRSVPRFENVAAIISNLPYRTLIRAVPRFSSVLRHAPPIGAQASIRLLYCMDRHPEGGPEFYRCLSDS